MSNSLSRYEIFLKVAELGNITVAAEALIPEMMLRTAGFRLISRPLEPRQYRTIGFASLPHDETPVLVRAFAEFCAVPLCSFFIIRVLNPVPSLP